MIARCTSFKCMGNSNKARGIVKSVPCRTIKCPDCGSALFWHKKDKKLHRSNKDKHVPDSRREFLDY